MESESRSTILLRIELLNIEPLIWRRVRVPTKWTLRRLHGLIQKVFGWEDRHLHDVLREALLSGELERGRVPALIDASERTARRVISALIEKRVLVSESHKASLRLGFPIDVVERWFPWLYPVGA